MRVVPAVVLAIVVAAASVSAEPEPTVEPETGPEAAHVQADQPRIRRVGPHLYRIGRVMLDASKRTVRLPGRVNMDRGGPIELLACLPRGKVHESVFTADVEPKDLQVALLLLGLKEGRNPAVRYPRPCPEADEPPGDVVLVFVQWRGPPEGDDGEPKPVRVRAEQFLFHVEKERPAEAAKWVFLGSQMTGGRFGADLDGSLITSYHDPLAILELSLPTVNDDIYYIVNEKLSPPIGTPVELVIELPPAEKDDADRPSAEAPEGPSEPRGARGAASEEGD